MSVSDVLSWLDQAGTVEAQLAYFMPSMCRDKLAQLVVNPGGPQGTWIKEVREIQGLKVL